MNMNMQLKCSCMALKSSQFSSKKFNATAGALVYCGISLRFNRNGTREVIEMMRSIATFQRA